MTASSRGLWLTDHSDQAPPASLQPPTPASKPRRKSPTLAVALGQIRPRAATQPRSPAANSKGDSNCLCGNLEQVSGPGRFRHP